MEAKEALSPLFLSFHIRGPFQLGLTVNSAFHSRHGGRDSDGGSYDDSSRSGGGSSFYPEKLFLLGNVKCAAALTCRPTAEVREGHSDSQKLRASTVLVGGRRKRSISLFLFLTLSTLSLPATAATKAFS